MEVNPCDGAFIDLDLTYATHSGPPPCFWSIHYRYSDAEIRTGILDDGYWLIGIEQHVESVHRDVR